MARSRKRPWGEFETMFAMGDMFCDFNDDGKLDFFDVLTFQTEIAVGCW